MPVFSAPSKSHSPACLLKGPSCLEINLICSLLAQIQWDLQPLGNIIILLYKNWTCETVRITCTQTTMWLTVGSVQSLSHVQHVATPWTAAHQAFLSVTNSQSLLNSCPSSRWCHPTISSSVVPFSSCLFPSIRVFSNESVLLIRWPK